MKGNDGTGNNPTRDLWKTNDILWDELNNQYCFNFDCCASIENSKTKHYTNDFESITKDDLKNKVCWMNPPFSKAREMFKHFFKVVSKGVAIYRCDNLETRIYQEIILLKASWIFIPAGRLRYTSFETGKMKKEKGARFPSALIGYNVEKPKLKNIRGVLLHT